MIPDWQKCPDHGGFGFHSDCEICKQTKIASGEKKLNHKVQDIENTLATLITWQLNTLGKGGVEQLLTMLNPEMLNHDEMWREKTKDHDKLMKFYGVRSYIELVNAQSNHIDSLQSKLPKPEQGFFNPKRPRG